jgi:chromosome segregation ATPase
MDIDSTGKELHDRLTRGEILPAAEMAALEAWYAQQDAEELTALSASPPREEITRLRQQVDEAVKTLRSATRDVEAQLAENDRIRAEIAALRQRLPLVAPPT